MQPIILTLPSGIAVLNGLVYAVGGFNGSLRVRTVDVYDPTRNMWSSVASMEARRSTLGVAVLNNRIYAVGGFDGTTGMLWSSRGVGGGGVGTNRKPYSLVQ